MTGSMFRVRKQGEMMHIQLEMYKAIVVDP